MATITFDSVSKTYADGTTAVHDLDLAIEDGEFMILVGPSGCGKSTALRMLAGLEEITGGEVRIGDRVVNQLAPRDRNIAMVFQNYALYPHMTVRDNLGFALKVAKTPKEEINRRVHDAAKMLGLTEYLDRKPKALSGGQRQRVAMGRAIVREPAAFLMDEPLSNLDAKLRVQMRSDIRQLQSRLGTTTVYVTHDQVEAMTMGDRVAVIRKGVLQQAAPPQELYERPDNVFVAGFIGSPAMNLISATVVQADGGLAVEIGPDRLALAEGALAAYPKVSSMVGQQVVMGIRPEHFEDATASDMPASQRLTVTTTLVEAMGSEIFLHFELAVPPPETEDTRELKEDVDDAAVEALSEEGATPITARLEPTTRARIGQPIELAVDTAKTHFFEPESGAALR